MPRSVTLPYFNSILDALNRGEPAVTEAFGRHVHWGYWGPGAHADGSSADFAAAAERMSRRICDAAGVCDGAQVLDAGCGFGGTVASLDARLSGARLIGLNIDARQLDRAKREVRPRGANEIVFIEGDACEIPLPDASCDAVIAVECIFHFPSRARFFQEARRVLRPGGRLALSDFIPIGPVEPLLRFQDLVFGRYVERVSGPVDIRMTRPRYRELARASGLRPLIEDDVTRATLPTYSALRPILRAAGAEVMLATLGAAALEAVSRSGLLRYFILSFERI